MIDVPDAWQVVDDAIPPLAATWLNVVDAVGRTIATPVIAPADDPPFARSAMDGFLLALDAGPGAFAITRELRPGAPPPKTPPPRGHAWKIFTGSALPDSGCGVVIVEDTKTLEPGRMRTLTPPSTGWIRPKGSHCSKHDILVSAGTTLTPGAIALVASFGISRIKARPSPTVAHIATGSEITPLGTRRRSGQIIDSNSPLVAALVAESHAKMLFHGRADETCDALTSQIATALDRKANVILVSGGASVGEHDHTRAALEQSGFTVHFHSINCRPGRPLIFATRGRTVAFGLPGNPLSHLVCFKLFVDRALRRLDGRPPNNPVPVSVAPPHPRRNSRETWWPANITAKHGALRARFLPWRDSSDLSGIATANGLVRVPAATPPKEAILWAPPHP